MASDHETRRRREKTARWRRRGLLRPSVAGTVLVLCCAGCWYAGLLLDDRVAVAAALTLTIVWLLALVIAGAQCLLMPRVVGHSPDRPIDWSPVGSASSAAPARASVPRGRLAWLLMPDMVRIQEQCERLDQDGRVIARMLVRRRGSAQELAAADAGARTVASVTSALDGLVSAADGLASAAGAHTAAMPRRVPVRDALPQGRGLYRRSASLVRWHEPFGLFAISSMLPDGGLVVQPPHDDGTVSQTDRMPERNVVGRVPVDDAGSVRAYVPGDPPKMISWKATAHRGDLMTRDTGNEANPTIIVVLDLRSPDGAETANDALADRLTMPVVPLLDRLHDGRRLIVTDGVRDASDRGSIRLLLAAAMPIVQDDASSLAAHVAQLAAGQRGAVEVRLITALPDGSLAHSLRERIGRERLRVIEAPARRTGTAGSPRSADAVSAGALPDAAVSADSAGRPRCFGGLTRRELLGRVLTTLALVIAFALTVEALTSLVDGDGYWPWFAGAALTAVALDANWPSRSRLRRAWRAGALLVGILVAAAVIVVLRVHDITGAWLFAMPRADQLVVSGGEAPAFTDAALFGDGGRLAPPWSVVAALVERGFQSLYAQLPPLDVNQASDLMLVAAAAGVAVLVRGILTARRIAPVFAAVPAALLVTDQLLVGRTVAWWHIGALVVVFVISLWAVRPQRAPAPLPLASSAVVAALVLALTPSAVNFAYGVPLTIGESAGLLSANTVDPTVDLKRSLRVGSEQTVLAYQATERMYLRLATLDEFNGDTWRFDDALAKDGGFYGAGLLLGNSGTGRLDDEDREGMYDDPLNIYTYLCYQYFGGQFNGNLSYSGMGGDLYAVEPDNGVGYTIMPDSSRYGDMSSFSSSARVRIASLRSRFLPVSGSSNSVYGVGTGWLRYGPTVYNRSATTYEDFTYAFDSVGLQPITSLSGFGQIDEVTALREQIEQSLQSSRGDPDERRLIRERIVDEGQATVQGHWMLLPIEVHDDGSVTDAHGDPVGVGVVEQSGHDADSYELMSNISFDDDFRERMAIGAGERIGQVTRSDGTSMLALLLTSADEATDEEAIDGYVDELMALVSSSNGEYGGLMVTGGGQTYDEELVDYLFDQIDATDRRMGAQYAALPNGTTGRMDALVDQARADGVAVGGENADAQIEAMRWLVDYFTDPANGFRYSLDAPDGGGQGNLAVLDDFLGSKAGYCTHYASALAVLGRAMGVPTRMVLGYNRGVGGTNASGEYEVASKQLHAWTEAYIDGVGWVPFDVTPATADNGSAEASDDQRTSQDDADDGLDSGVDGGDTPTDVTDAEQDGVSDSGEEDQSGADQSEGPVDAAGGDAANGAGSQTLIWQMPSEAILAVRIIGGVLLAAALLAVPAAIRSWRRRRRLRRVAAVRHAEAARRAETVRGSEIVRGGRAARSGEERRTEAWKAAWDEIQDTAWDAGVRWTAGDTDRMIAARIDEAGIARDDRSDHARDLARNVADQTTAVVFGGDMPTVPDTLRDDVAAFCAQCRAARRRSPIVTRIVGVLFPASLFMRRAGRIGGKPLKQQGKQHG